MKINDIGDEGLDYEFILTPKEKGLVDTMVKDSIIPYLSNVFNFAIENAEGRPIECIDIPYRDFGVDINTDLRGRDIMDVKMRSEFVLSIGAGHCYHSLSIHGNGSPLTESELNKEIDRLHVRCKIERESLSKINDPQVAEMLNQIDRFEKLGVEFLKFNQKGAFLNVQ